MGHDETGGSPWFKIRITVLLLLLAMVAGALCYDRFYLSGTSEKAFVTVDKMLNETVQEGEVKNYTREEVKEKIGVEPVSSREIKNEKTGDVKYVVDLYKWQRMTPVSMSSEEGKTFDVFPTYNFEVAYKKERQPASADEKFVFNLDSVVRQAEFIAPKEPGIEVNPSGVQDIQMPAGGGPGPGAAPAGGGRAKKAERLRVDAFMDNDIDANGEVSREEVKGKRVEKTFDKADADKNDIVTRDEIEALAKTVNAEIDAKEAEEKKKAEEEKKKKEAEDKKKAEEEKAKESTDDNKKVDDDSKKDDDSSGEDKADDDKADDDKSDAKSDDKADKKSDKKKDDKKG